MSMRARIPLSDGASVSSADTPAIPRDAAALTQAFVARDGALLHKRAMHADDAARLQAFHSRLSSEAIVFRFFGALTELGNELAGRLSHVGYEHRMAVVATLEEGADEQIIAVARFQREDSESAEIALAVEDRWQGQGIGHHLLWTLAAYGRRRGFTALIARVMPENERMFTLLRHSGLPTVYDLQWGSIVARMDITDLDLPTPLSWDTAP